MYGREMGAAGMGAVGMGAAGMHGCEMDGRGGIGLNRASFNHRSKTA